jgi:hypothetical protein
MRRIATSAGIAIAMLVPAAGPAHADHGFWRSAGLSRVDALGVYRAGPARVRLSFVLRKTKGRGSPAVRFTFTERHRPDSVRLAALRPYGHRSAWATVTSANTGHLYTQECLGAWHARTFHPHRCGGWRRRY